MAFHRSSLFPIVFLLLCFVSAASVSAADQSVERFGLLPPVTQGPIKDLPEGPLVPVPKFDPVGPTQMEYDCFNLINEARANPGAYGYGSYSPAPPLHWNAAMLYIAWVHSKDMYDEDYFEHDSYNRVGGNLVFDRSWSERIRSIYTHNTTISENIAWNSTGSVQGAVTQWMNSPPHRETIMNADLTEGAIGIYGGTDKVYFTHDFGARAISYNLTIAAGEVALDPASPSPGDTVKVIFTTQNTGVTDVFPVEVILYTRPSGGSWTPETEILWLPNILEGGKTSRNYVSVDTSGMPGGTEVRIAIDPNGRLSETNENDNLADVVLLPGGGTLPGDLSGNGVLDGLDLFRFSLGWQTADPVCNLDGSGSVRCSDLIMLVKMLK